MKPSVIWFLTGSQHLYGEETLRHVEANARQIAASLSEKLPLQVVFKPVLTTSDAIRSTLLSANSAADCAGLILWMHTFSPSKMWIGGLSFLRKPLLHLHTQFNRDLPWDAIDMDFMNLNQSAHGDREAGFIHTRMRLNRKVVAGHWRDPAVVERLAVWTRAARAWHDWQGAKIVRFGDNMRQVAVTEGDKVSAEMRFGFSVNTHGIGDLAADVADATDYDIDSLCSEYAASYTLAADLQKGASRHDALREAARIEIGLRSFLTRGGYCGFTTTFEDLHGLRQLPGIAVQRLMADGYGFGAEGDWKTAALLRAMKVMASDLGGRTSFMEDYTYHLEPGNHLVLGSHMLEICPSISSSRPTCEVHPLGIGGKEDPVRLVFDAPEGAALNASLIDLGNRFRLVINEVDVVKPPQPLPRLPVARAVWKCRPDFSTACESWILAGGAHHTGFSYTVTREHLQDFACLAGIECVIIGAETQVDRFQSDLRVNEVFYHLNAGFTA
ncbi:MAG: L-arabinose isomerase [Candidatus Methylacidiphilales bacterium]